MATTVGVIGSGEVGVSLAKGFAKYRYDVMIGTNNPSKQQALKERAGKKVKVGTFAETAAYGSMLVLAVKGSGAEAAVQLAGAENFKGKVVMDTTNPIADAPPANGVIPYFTRFDESLMERLQRAVPEARFVKTFSCVGSAHMVDPKFGRTKPAMFICGNNERAKKDVSKILAKFGWEAEDMGQVEGARAIEPLAILWCIPGFLRNDWKHAFKLLKKK